MVQKDIITALIRCCGFDESGSVEIKNLIFDEEVREICAGNGCGQYNKTWACPPGTGTLEECREKCMKYSKMLLFNKVYELEDSYDFEGMIEGMSDFKERIFRLDTLVEKELTEYMILGNEGCVSCKRCTWPDAPCRFPDKLYYPIEAFGFHVGKLAEAAGLTYNNGRNTVTFFGAILYCIQLKTTLTNEMDACIIK